MSINKQSGKELYSFLLAALLILSIFFVQYVFRYADDNRLTSWEWTLAAADLKLFAGALVLGTISAYLLSRLTFYLSRPVIFLFLLSFMVSAIFWKEAEVIVDTSRYFTQAKYLETYGIKYFILEWGKGIDAWTDMPLISFLYGLIFRFMGESRVYIQIFTTFLFSMTVVLTYYIGKGLWDEETGFSAGALLLGIPYLYSQIPLMLVDVPTMFFLTLSVFTFIRALEKGGIWNGIASIAIFSAVFSKYSTGMMLSVLPVIFLVYLVQKVQKSEYKSPHPPFAKGGRGGIIQTLIYRGMSVAFLAGFLVAVVVLFKFDVISQQIRFLQEYQAPGLRRWGESFVSTFLFQVHPLITLAAMYSVYEAFRKRDLKFIIACWLVLLVLVFQIKRSRYIMVIFPMFTLMASYCFQKIKTIELRRFIAFSIISSSLVTAYLAYLPFLENMSIVNIRDAGRFLNSIQEKRIEVFTIPSTETIVNLAVSVPILDLYTNKEILYRHDPAYSPPLAEIKESPLRFTWEYKNPPYYSLVGEHKQIPSPLAGEGKGGGALVIISNGDFKSLPDNIAERLKGHENVRVFNTSEGIFSFSPVVTVYLPDRRKD